MTRLAACIMPLLTQLMVTKKELASVTQEHQAESERLKRRLEEVEAAVEGAERERGRLGGELREQKAKVVVEGAVNKLLVLALKTLNPTAAVLRDPAAPLHHLSGQKP